MCASISCSIHAYTYLCVCMGVCLLYLGISPCAPLSAALSASSFPVSFECPLTHFQCIVMPSCICMRCSICFESEISVLLVLGCHFPLIMLAAYFES